MSIEASVSPSASSCEELLVVDDVVGATPSLSVSVVPLLLVTETDSSITPGEAADMVMDETEVPMAILLVEAQSVRASSIGLGTDLSDRRFLVVVVIDEGTPAGGREGTAARPGSCA